MGVAVKLMVLPTQKGFTQGTMLTAGNGLAMTVSVMIFDVAVAGLAQLRFDIITQAI